MRLTFYARVQHLAKHVRELFSKHESNSGEDDGATKFNADTFLERALPTQNEFFDRGDELTVKDNSVQASPSTFNEFCQANFSSTTTRPPKSTIFTWPA